MFISLKNLFVYSENELNNYLRLSNDNNIYPTIEEKRYMVVYYLNKEGRLSPEDIEIIKNPSFQNIIISSISYEDFLQKMDDNNLLSSSNDLEELIELWGIQRFSNALKVNNTVKELYLSHDNFGDEEIKYLSEALKVNNSLTKLNLSYNNIGDEGIKYLSEALKFNKTLK